MIEDTIELNKKIFSLQDDLSQLITKLNPIVDKLTTLDTEMQGIQLEEIFSQCKGFYPLIQQLELTMKQLQNDTMNQSIQKEVTQLQSTLQDLLEQESDLNILLNQNLTIYFNSQQKKLNTLFSKISSNECARNTIIASQNEIDLIFTPFINCDFEDKKLPISIQNTLSVGKKIKEQQEQVKKSILNLSYLSDEKTRIIEPLQQTLSRLTEKTNCMFGYDLHLLLGKYVCLVYQDPTQVLSFIENNKRKITNNIQLKAHLNLIIANVLDLKLSVPSTYDSESSEIDETTLPSKAQNILKEMEHDNKKYAEATNMLYQHINEIIEKVPEATELAKNLQHTLDFFVVQHAKTLPTKKQFEDFTYHFQARLYSKEDVLDKNMSWKAILANIAIGLLTLGIAIGIKLVHSQVKYGGYYFFFDEVPKARKETQSLEQNISLISDILPKSGG